MNRFVDEFADPEFIDLNRPFFERYVELRVRGFGSRVSFVKIFGTDNYGSPADGYKRCNDIEESDFYKERFELRLKEITTGELWNTKQTMHELLSIVRDDSARDATRLNAVKELNVLCGITIVDENGKTKAGRTLADFYKTEGINRGSAANAESAPDAPKSNAE